MVDLGIIFARYFKANRYYLILHGISMIIIVGLTLIVELVLIKESIIFMIYLDFANILGKSNLT